MVESINWKTKYLKYKLKYEKLKQKGGMNTQALQRALDGNVAGIEGHWYYVKDFQQIFKIYRRDLLGNITIGDHFHPIRSIHYSSPELKQYEIYHLGPNAPGDFHFNNQQIGEYQFARRNIFVQNRNEVESLPYQPLQVAVIGAGPIALVLLFKLLTEPFFEEAMKLPNKKISINIISNKIINATNDSFARDMCTRIDINLDAHANIGLPTNLIDKNEAYELQREQVFLLKEEEYNALPTLIKDLVKNVSCGHHVTPDKFHSMHCVNPQDSSVRYYSLEIRMFEAILWKAIHMVVNKATCINSPVIPNLALNLDTSAFKYIHIPNFNATSEESLNKILPHYSYVFNCAGAMQGDPNQYKLNRCGYPSDYNILMTQGDAAKKHKIPKGQPSRESEVNMFANARTENDNNYYQGLRPTNGNVNLVPTCKEFGSIFIIKFNNDIIGLINYYADYISKKTEKVYPMNGIKEYIFNNYWVPLEAPNEYGNTEFRLFPARNLNPNDLGGIYIGHLLTPEENQLLRDRNKYKLELSQPKELLIGERAQAREEEKRKFRVLQWTPVDVNNPVITREQSIMNSLIIKIAAAMRRFGISPYMINWTNPDIQFSSFPLIWAINNVRFHENGNSNNRYFAVGDSGYSAHYLTYSGVNNGLKTIRHLFNIPQTKNIYQKNTSEVTAEYAAWGNTILEHAREYYQTNSQRFSAPKLLTVEGKPDQPLQNLSYKDILDYINSDFDYFEENENSGHYITVSQDVYNFHNQAGIIFNDRFDIFLDYLFSTIK